MIDISPKGFVLIGVILAIAVLGISLGVANLSLFLTLEKEKEEETREEIKLLVEAIGGNPKFRTFGYIGDMGRLPNHLAELNTIGNQKAFGLSTNGTQNFFRVGMGWNGFYLSETFQDSYLRDAWNNDYVYTIETVSVDFDHDPNTPPANWRRARITSIGADKAFGTNDDIKSEDIWESGALRVRVTVGQSLVIPANMAMVVYSSQGGNQGSQTLTGKQAVQQAGEFEVLEFPVLHHGYHAFDLTLGAGTVQEQGILNIFSGVMNFRRVVK